MGRSLSEADLLAIYKEATGDDPHAGPGARVRAALICDDMRRVIAASSLPAAVREIARWDNEPATARRIARKVRALAAKVRP